MPDDILVFYTRQRRYQQRMAKKKIGIACDDEAAKAISIENIDGQQAIWHRKQNSGKYQQNIGGGGRRSISGRYQRKRRR